MVRPFIAPVLAWLMLTGTAWAQLVNENLLVGLPPGFKIAFQDKKNNMVMTEAVPSNETLENWTEMVTIQIFRGMKGTPDQFRDRLQTFWLSVCTDGRGDEITKGAEKGYPFAIFVLSCPKNPKTGKMEITWVKTLQGNDSFYVVQKAFKYMLSKEQTSETVRYLGGVTVCDSRIAERRCPQTRN